MNEGLGLAIIGAAAVVVIAYYKTLTPETGRMVLTWRKNADGTCTYTYDDGSQETAVCSDPPV